MRYAVARFQREQQDMAYRIFVTDCLRMITQSTAAVCQGTYMDARFADFINGKPADTRTGDEIAVDIIRRAGIEVVQ